LRNVFSFNRNATRARDEILDALSVTRSAPQPQMQPMPPQMRPQMPQMQPGMPQPGIPQMQPGMPQPQMQQPGMQQMGIQQLGMPQMSRQMGAPMRFKSGGAVRAEDLAVKREQYASGGGAVKPIWEKNRPDDLGKPKGLSVKKKAFAKRRAKAAGRPYPNMVDNLAAARKKGK
jgi:hypothetical protein